MNWDWLVKNTCVFDQWRLNTRRNVVFWPFASKTRLLGLRAEAGALIMLSLTHLSSQNITSDPNITSNYDIRYHSWMTAQSMGRPLETTAVWALLWLQWRFICMSLLNGVPGKLKMKFSFCSAGLNLFFSFFCIILRLKSPLCLSCDKQHPLSISALARRLAYTRANTHTHAYTHTETVPTSFIILGMAEKQFVLSVTDLMQSALLHAPEWGRRRQRVG